jgi:hypothetical protein
MNALPENFYRKIVSSMKIIPHHHPEFIYEILSMGHFELAEVILHKCLQSLKLKGYISSKFSINIERLGDLF